MAVQVPLKIVGAFTIKTRYRLSGNLLCPIPKSEIRILNIAVCRCLAPNPFKSYTTTVPLIDFPDIWAPIKPLSRADSTQKCHQSVISVTVHRFIMSIGRSLSTLQISSKLPLVQKPHLAHGISLITCWSRTPGRRCVRGMIPLMFRGSVCAVHRMVIWMCVIPSGFFPRRWDIVVVWCERS